MKSNTGKQNLTVSYSYIQGFFWMSFAAVMGFTSIYLLNAGFTNTKIGLIIAAGGIISALLQPAVASYADKPHSPSIKKIAIILTAMLIGSAIVLVLCYQRSPLLTGLFYGVCITLLQLLLPFINALGMESINQGKELNFGAGRCGGSVAYAIAAYALGLIVAKTGEISIPVSILLISVIFIFVLFRFPFTKVKKMQNPAAKQGSGSPLTFFARYRKFSFVLIGCMLLYISHVLLNSFTFQIVESKGGGSSEMGFAMALAAIIELPVLFFFTGMTKKVRCDIWFRISGIFFMLKALGTLLVPSILPFYFVQVFQMGGWALISVSSVYYVNSIMEEQDIIKGQAYMTMVYTLGSVLAALIGGFFIDKAGVNAMLAFATATAFIGMIIVLFASEKTEA